MKSVGRGSRDENCIKACLERCPCCFLPRSGVNDAFRQNFGLLIAFVLPGFMAVWGIGFLSPIVHGWLLARPDQAPTIGGFLYVTLASIAAGVTISAVRWLVIDSLHHSTGIPIPEWDYSNLETKLDAYESIAEDHYRYYQFYSNMLVAVAFAFAAYRLSHPAFIHEVVMIDLPASALEVVLFAASRDCLGKYYSRMSRLLGVVSPQQRSSSDDERKVSPQESNQKGKRDEVSVG